MSMRDSGQNQMVTKNREEILRLFQFTVSFNMEKCKLIIKFTAPAFVHIPGKDNVQPVDFLLFYFPFLYVVFPFPAISSTLSNIDAFTLHYVHFVIRKFFLYTHKKPCPLIASYSFPKQSLVFMILRERSFENIAGKGEECSQQLFSPFPSMFSILSKTEIDIFHPVPKFIVWERVKSKPDDKILALSKLKIFANDNLSMAQCCNFI